MTDAMWLVMAVLAIPVVLALATAGCGTTLGYDEDPQPGSQSQPQPSKDPRARLGEMPTELPPPPAGPAPAPTYVDTVTGTMGLIGYWRLGEKQSVLSMAKPQAVNALGVTTLNGDYTNPTSGINLDLSGALVKDTDTAVRFGGTGGYVQVPPQVALSPDEVAVELWMKFDAAATDWRVLAACYEGDFADNVVRGYRLRARTVTDAGVLNVQIDGALGGLVTPLQLAVPMGQVPAWHHVVLTYHKAPLGAELAELYVDTQVVSAQSKCTLVPTNPRPLRMAANNASPFATTYQVSLDEVALYGQAMSKTTVENHFKVATT